MKRQSSLLQVLKTLLPAGAVGASGSLVNGAIVGIGGKCIDIAAGVPEELSPLILAQCTGSMSQQWSLH